MSEGTSGGPSAGAAATLSGSVGTTSAEAPAKAPGVQTQSPDWMSGFAPDIKDYVVAKGWRDPSAMVESYRHFERFQGVPADRLAKIPAREDDAEGWATLRRQLGTPDAPEGYGVTELAGDKDAAVQFAKIAHKAGLDTRQAKALLSEVQEIMQQDVSRRQTEVKTKAAEEQTALLKDWALDYDKNVAVAQRGAAALGFDTKTLEGLENQLGFAGLMRLCRQAGVRVGEDRFISGSGGQSGPLSPDAAQAKIASLKSDAGWTKKYLSGDKGAVEEMTKLQMLALGMK